MIFYKILMVIFTYLNIRIAAAKNLHLQPKLDGKLVIKTKND
ncbi:MAG: hypothetical protein RL667_984 [Pseudomonadota bacterium]